MAIIYETQQLAVREFTPDDVRQIYEYSQEESLKEGLPENVYNSVQETRKILDSLISNYSDDSDKIFYPYALGITIKGDRQLIGTIALSILPEKFEDDVTEVIYSIGERYQNKGYATEALIGMVDWAKNKLHIPEIYALILRDNQASCKVLEKAGFSYRAESDKQRGGVTAYYKVYTI